MKGFNSWVPPYDSPLRILNPEPLFGFPPLQHDSEVKGMKILHTISAMGWEKNIPGLLKLPEVDIDGRDSNGCTALHWAVTTGKYDFYASPLVVSTNYF